MAPRQPDLRPAGAQYLLEMARTCSRTGCSRSATTTMSYGYGVRTAWLDDLDPDHFPAGYDLCAEHADGLRVPEGWRRTDRRTATRPLLARRAG